MQRVRRSDPRLHKQVMASLSLTLLLGRLLARSSMVAYCPGQWRSLPRPFGKPSTNFYVAIGLTVTLAMAFIGYHLSTLSWRVEKWTAYRDFYEICLQMKQAYETLSEECSVTLGRGVPRPPFIKRYLDVWIDVHPRLGLGILGSQRRREDDPLILTIVVLGDILCQGAISFGLYRLISYALQVCGLRRQLSVDRYSPDTDEIVSKEFLSAADHDDPYISRKAKRA